MHLPKISFGGRVGDRPLTGGDIAPWPPIRTARGDTYYGERNDIYMYTMRVNIARKAVEWLDGSGTSGLSCRVRLSVGLSVGLLYLAFGGKSTGHAHGLATWLVSLPVDRPAVTHPRPAGVGRGPRQGWTGPVSPVSIRRPVTNWTAPDDVRPVRGRGRPPSTFQRPKNERQRGLAGSPSVRPSVARREIYSPRLLIGEGVTQSTSSGTAPCIGPLHGAGRHLHT